MISIKRTVLVLFLALLAGCAFEELEDPDPGIFDPNNDNNDNNVNNANNLNNLNSLTNLNNVLNNLNIRPNNVNNSNNANNTNNTNSSNNSNNANNNNNVITRGDVCQNGQAPRADFCNVVTQDDCAQGYCDLTLQNCDAGTPDDCPAGDSCGDTGPFTNICLDPVGNADLIPQCVGLTRGTAGPGEACGGNVSCRPGLNCAMGTCQRYCQIDTGLGCPTDQFCLARPGMERYGFGFCVPMCPSN